MYSIIQNLIIYRVFDECYLDVQKSQNAIVPAMLNCTSYDQTTGAPSYKATSSKDHLSFKAKFQMHLAGVSKFFIIGGTSSILEGT